MRYCGGYEIKTNQSEISLYTTADDEYDRRVEAKMLKSWARQEQRTTFAVVLASIPKLNMIYSIFSPNRFQ